MRGVCDPGGRSQPPIGGSRGGEKDSKSAVALGCPAEAGTHSATRGDGNGPVGALGSLNVSCITTRSDKQKHIHPFID